MFSPNNLGNNSITKEQKDEQGDGHTPVRRAVREAGPS